MSDITKLIIALEDLTAEVRALRVAHTVREPESGCVPLPGGFFAVPDHALGSAAPIGWHVERRVPNEIRQENRRG
jgi:hypothetical protein